MTMNREAVYEAFLRGDLSESQAKELVAGFEVEVPVFYP